jgi:hypothetical protein
LQKQLTRTTPSTKNPTNQAFEAPPAQANETEDAVAAAACAAPCFVAGDTYPFRACRAQCDKAVCSRSAFGGGGRRGDLCAKPCKNWLFAQTQPNQPNQPNQNNLNT